VLLTVVSCLFRYVTSPQISNPQNNRLFQVCGDVFIARFCFANQKYEFHSEKGFKGPSTPWWWRSMEGKVIFYSIWEFEIALIPIVFRLYLFVLLRTQTQSPKILHTKYLPYTTKIQKSLYHKLFVCCNVWLESPAFMNNAKCQTRFLHRFMFQSWITNNKLSFIYKVPN
jgi:hypothetical protein